MSSRAAVFARIRNMRDLERLAGPRSTGFCARYVQAALQGVGQFSGHAYQMADQLEASPAFYEVRSNSPARIGDVVVFQPVGRSRYGHVALLTHKGWISDFRQKRGIYAGPAYVGQPFRLFRVSEEYATALIGGASGTAQAT